MFDKVFSFFNKIRFRQQGFTLLGVLVASGVGLIVVTGLSQLFVNMSSQLQHMEDKAKHGVFRDSLWDTLKAGCENTLKPNASDVANGNAFPFGEIRDGNDRVAVNLATEKPRLESEYGLTGHFNFQMNCANPQPDGTTDCDCESVTPNPTPTTPCTKKWVLSLISQREIKGILVYNRTFSFDLNIEYDHKPSTPTPPTLTYEGFTCNVTAIVGSSTPPPTPDCFTVDTPNNIVLVGCGSNKGITEPTTTSYGFDAGSAGVGQYNTLMGYEVGKSSTGDNNTFMGYQAGKANTSGFDNTFIGSQAGQINSSGENNTFVGYLAGITNQTGSNNVIIGYNAGHFAPNASNKFAIGNNNARNWLEGDIGMDTLEVNSKAVCLRTNSTTITCGASTITLPASSRTLKKKIKPFKDFKKTLNDLLKTPLFTFEYKEDPIKKSRMGVISEELPEHLQIKEKDKPSTPDWISIYGSFWAGIKALHEMLTEFKQEFSSKIKNIEKTLSQKLEDFNQEFFSQIKILSSNLNLFKKPAGKTYQRAF